MAASPLAITKPTDTITVVIAVRNGMPFIVTAVSSALALGESVARVVVVDDGSTDGTRTSIEAIGDARVTIIDNPGSGVSSARNAGAAISDTSWLLFLDADDCLVGNAGLALLHTAAQTPAAVVIYGDYERVDAEGRRVGRRFLVRKRQKPSGGILNQLVRGNFIINGGIAIVRRDIFQEVGGFSPALSLCEDWHLWCRLAARGPVIYTPQCVMNYRVHTTSVMMRTLRRFADFKPALEAIFGDPAIIAIIPSEQIVGARSDAEVSLKTYCASQALRNGARTTGLRMALEAAFHRPAKAPWVILRVAGALAGL